MSISPLKPVEFTVAFDDADGEGIVFFGNYFRLAHRAFEQFLPQLNITWKEWFANPEWGVPLRHAESDYLRPLRPGNLCSVVIRVTEIGENSVHFSYELSHEGSVVARLKTSHVFVSRTEFKKLRVPDHIRSRLAPALIQGSIATKPS